MAYAFMHFMHVMHKSRCPTTPPMLRSRAVIQKYKRMFTMKVLANSVI